MNQRSSSPISAGNPSRVTGTIRDQHQEPMPKATVRAYHKGLRGQQLLGEAITDNSGAWSIEYTPKASTGTDLIIKVYDADKTLLKETEVQYNVPASLQKDIDLAERPYAGIPEFDRLTAAITPFIGDTGLAKLTETEKNPDISYLIGKTQLSGDSIEQLVMASRFEEYSAIDALAWYGILSMPQFPDPDRAGIPDSANGRSFEARLHAIFDDLMHTSVDELVKKLEYAIDRNTVAYATGSSLKKIRKQLQDQVLAYAKAHPVSGDPSHLYLKSQLGGLKAKELDSFLEAHNQHTDGEESFFKEVRKTSGLRDSKHLDQVQAVFHLSRLTGHDLDLTEKLMKAEKIKSPDELKKFAAYDRKDWKALTTKGAQLEKTFSVAFPTAAFSARLEKDTKSRLPHRDKISKFLQKNGHFDLLHTRIGQFLKDNKGAAPEKDAPVLADQLRRVQRVFKLTPHYETAQLLLNDNIHSAHQIYKMGQDNFVAAYGEQLGTEEATAVFEKAATVHTTAVALVGNLRSMADAGAIKAFPDFNKAITTSLTQELPSLDTLFGHTDLCECDECRSVYGAPAYLTDILHYLENRVSSLAVTGKSTSAFASVKDLLLQRRPDLGDIDLNCANANTEIPYIDIACELMEDYIAPPAMTIAIGLLPKFVAGPIDPTVLAAIIPQFPLLTAGAIVSQPYSTGRLKTDNTYVTEGHWVIRDSQITLKATNLTSSIEIRLLHQTLLPSDEVSANPEYVNTAAYALIKNAKRPFTLPFDLSDMEGKMYLEKAGVKKEDLIRTFYSEDKTITTRPFLSDLNAAYANLGINAAEVILIFVPDQTNQVNYWGPGVVNNSVTAGGVTFTGVPVRLFEQCSGLNYSQIIDLLSCPFVNPGQTIVLFHLDTTTNTATTYIKNLGTQVQLDLVHRFLRLWRKTNLTMSELNAIIMSPAMGQGAITNPLAWQLQRFIQLQQRFQLSAFQLLGFYQDLDTSTPDCLYNQLFQNIAVTNPVSPDFSIAQVKAGAQTITDARKPIIAAALQLSKDDLALLLPLTNGALSLSNLSLIYRYAQIAAGLQIPVSDLLILLQLIDTNPFASPGSTYIFLERYDVLRSSGFSIQELNYILRHQDNSDHTLVPTGNQVTTNLSQLQNDLLAIQASTSPAVDANGLLLTKWLSDAGLKWDPSLVNRLVDLLNTVDDDAWTKKLTDNSNFLLNLRMVYHDLFLTANLPALPVTGTPAVPITFPAAQTVQVSYDGVNRQLRLIGYLSAADRTALLALSTDAAYQAAVNLLYNNAQLTDSSAGNLIFTNAADITTNLQSLLSTNIPGRFALFINKLSPVYRTLQQKSLLVKDLSTWFAVDKKVATQLLVSIPAIFTDLTNSNFIGRIPASGPYPVQTNRYLMIAKICFVAVKLKLTDLDLAFLLAKAATINSLNFQALPITPVNTAVTTFNTFEALIGLLKFGKYYPARVTNAATNATISIYNVLSGTATATLANLVLLTGWNTDELNKLAATPNYLNLVLPGDLLVIRILLRLHKCFTVLAQLDIKAADAVAWSAPSLQFADTANIKQSLKSKFGDSDWKDLTTPLQNTLREKKRDALITYMLANPGTQTWTTDNDLYSYFLLDVEMCSCQPTSRIVQATNTVQLFVQRCFLTLEPSVAVRTKADSSAPNSSFDTAWLQWPWMKNFRVWQANVKVFLYPENWIEPELLPDEIKSPFLKELENDLLQNEVTATNVEDAFHNYLEQLNGVARLEVKGMYYDNPSKTLHVFARTFGGDPKAYYYRKMVADRRWTPWVKVDVDITSDHIIPAVYNNHVYLYWAIITEKPDTTTSLPGITIPQVNTTYPIPQPKKVWQVQLAFSEYKNGKWTPKRLSGNDATGQLLIDQATYPKKENLIFTPLDVPRFDYSKIFNNDAAHTHIDTPAVYNQKAGDAISRSGNLVISCYYYSWISNNNANNCTYLSSFQIDPVKGYPTKLSVPYKVQLPQSMTKSERSNRDSILVNMLDTEVYTGAVTVTPPTNGIPGSGPGNQYLVAEQAGGSFANLIPMQMSYVDSVVYMLNIYGGGASASFSVQTNLGTQLPYFYQDQRRSYYVVSEYTDQGAYEFLYSDYYNVKSIFMAKGQAAADAELAKIPANVPQTFKSRYFNFHHPLVEYFTQQLFAGGIGGLMDRDTQLKGDFGYDPAPGKFSFQNYFQPVISGFDTIYNGSALPAVIHNGVTDTTPGYPKDNVDFNLQSGYGLYNWELFFHAPLMIAERLSQNQQFDDAERWYRYIFNPMDMSSYPSPNKYWITQPFFLATSNDYTNQRIENVLKGINGGQLDLVKDVTDWRNNPFQPHYIAQYRTVAYQKTAVMKYVGHLVRHGDYLFQQHTMESVNEATQLYILAAEILGPKPEIIPPIGKTAVDNYYQLEQKLDVISDALVDVENLMPMQTINGYNGVKPVTVSAATPNLQTLYFCIPMNENLTGPTGYWDTVADRLYKIRHCLDIDGNLAPLSLFSAAIDPGMLVRASAAGLDIGSILNDMNGPLPLYRFMIMMQKATELCNEVKSLGSALLSVLEKKDAETMSLLRSSHEIKLFDAILQVKKRQIDDAQAAVDNLNKQIELVGIRQKYYTGLIAAGLNQNEKDALDKSTEAAGFEDDILGYYRTARTMSYLPDATLGVSGLGSPVITGTFGMRNLIAAEELGASEKSTQAAQDDKNAAILNMRAGHIRRAEEWQNQLNMADKELEQMGIQLLGAQIRLDIAKKEVANQQLQVDQSKESDDLMHSKFTNEDLFNWMITQVSTTYFQSYQLAYDIAKRTERCFRYELGLADSAYINFGYWDSLKRGLQAGEKLSFDLKTMEMAYFEQNRRELELTKPISLSLLDPVALLKLKTTGDCWINLPEELFDMDYPGHYMRRIKSVSLTIPCITGPYTTVSCTLTMTKNSVRISGISGDAATYSRKQSNGIPADDPRFRDAIGALQSIATSSAQNDSGLFEMNFRDERYLPFEGAGAISLWHLQLPAAVRQFNYDTISDVIIHLKYTARDGGDALKANATTSLTTGANPAINQMLVSTKDTGLMRIFSAKNDLATEWYRFLNPANATDDQVLTLNLDKTRFPLFAQSKTIKITSIELAADISVAPPNSLQAVSPSAVSAAVALAGGKYGTLLSATVPYNNDPGTWLIKNPAANRATTDGKWNNMVIIVHYTVA